SSPARPGETVIRPLQSTITYGVALPLSGAAGAVRLPAGTDLAPRVRGRRRADRSRVHAAHAARLAALRRCPVPAALPGVQLVSVPAHSRTALPSRPQ